MPIIVCDESIPCNPCQLVCPTGAIVVGSPITNKPVVTPELCIGCGKCVAACPGLAVFLLDKRDEDVERITIPYELLPLPNEGDEVMTSDDLGRSVSPGRVHRVQTGERFDRTALVTLEVPKPFGFRVRSFKPKG